jgi:hypothetical protein
MVRSSAMLMRALDVARAVDPPDWLIGSGVIRNLVWHRLHGFEPARRAADREAIELTANTERGEDKHMTV